MSALPVIRVEPGRFDDVVSEAVAALFASPLLGGFHWGFGTTPPGFTTGGGYEFRRHIDLDEALTIAARWEGLYTYPPTKVVRAVQCRLSERAREDQERARRAAEKVAEFVRTYRGGGVR
ncbi:MAG TPA: hypothetical protein VJP77_09810 [Planctomycetota bacterium]|nr:hypothetical protein [Planctomycetota bacterium]